MNIGSNCPLITHYSILNNAHGRELLSDAVQNGGDKIKKCFLRYTE